MRIIEPLEEGNVYHIFNRGNNGEDIFKETRNYYYFLKKFEEYCSPVLDTFAYNLLKNHFHLMIRVKENTVVPRRDGKGNIKLNASTQLSHFFNCYAQSINKAQNRHGKLFEEPFRRKEVNSESYFTSIIYYIHFNAQQHGFVKDFQDWEFSSWKHYLTDEKTFLERAPVLEWFGNKDQFIRAHLGNNSMDNITHLIIE
jgi:REP element-mobilizing transposase RayT